MFSRRHISRIALAGIALAAVSSAAAQPAPAPELRPVNVAYVEGRLVDFRPINGASTWTVFRTSTSRFAHLFSGKPRDTRPNLYIVAPGTQMHHDDAPGFDHNLVLSAVPARTTPIEFDVYYAIILDPALHDDLQGERELIMATQQSFQPSEAFAFVDIPGAVLLEGLLNIHFVRELDGFRRANGALPRLIVVPARVVLRAIARELPPLAGVKSGDAPDLPESAPSAGAATARPAADSVADPRPPQ